MPDWYKISKIYVGTDQVRPTVPTSFSYDFKTMSLADLTAAWFTYTWLNNGVPATDSTKWFYSTHDWQAVLSMPIDLTTANSISITCVYYGYSGSWVWGCRHWISTSIQESTGSADIKVLWELQMNNNSGYNYQAIYVAGSRKAWNSLTLSSWEYTCILSVDLTTWAVLWDEWVTTANYTLSASEIAAARTATYMCLVAGYNWWKQHQLWSAEWEIQ